jgi:hypothetical protein
VHYYQNLFTTTNPVGVQESIIDVECRVTDSMNTQLLGPFTTEEIDLALS